MLIFIFNFIKNKFGVETEKVIATIIKDEPIKIIEAKGTVVKEEKKMIQRFSQVSLILFKKMQMIFMKK